jgi:hypothetical protein
VIRLPRDATPEAAQSQALDDLRLGGRMAELLPERGIVELGP